MLPLQQGLPCRGYQQRVPGQSTRSHNISVLAEHGVDYHGARDVRLPREWRILRLNREDLSRYFDVRANANNSFHCGRLWRWDRYGSPRAADNSAKWTSELSFVPHGKPRCCEDLQVVVHSGHHHIRQILVHVMPDGAQLMHIAESEKSRLLVLHAKIPKEYRLSGATEQHCTGVRN